MDNVLWRIRKNEELSNLHSEADYTAEVKKEACKGWGQ